MFEAYLGASMTVSAFLLWKIWRTWRPMKAWTPHVMPKKPGFVLPPADETAFSVARFRRAAAQYMLVEYLWDNLSKGKARALRRPHQN